MGGNGRPLSNPNPVEVKMSDGKKSILLHYDTHNNGGDSRLVQMWSHDDGLTWTDQKEISQYMPQGFANCMPGPSVGVQSSAGTIYFSCHGYGGAILYWSKDFGNTWKSSDVVKGLNECTIALQ